MFDLNHCVISHLERCCTLLTFLVHTFSNHLPARSSVSCLALQQLTMQPLTCWKSSTMSFYNYQQPVTSEHPHSCSVIKPLALPHARSLDNFSHKHAHTHTKHLLQEPWEPGEPWEQLAEPIHPHKSPYREQQSAGCSFPPFLRLNRRPDALLRPVLSRAPLFSSASRCVCECVRKRERERMSVFVCVSVRKERKKGRRCVSARLCVLVCVEGESVLSGCSQEDNGEEGWCR